MTPKEHILAIYPSASVIDLQKLQKMDRFTGSHFPNGFFIGTFINDDTDPWVLTRICDTIEEAWEEAWEYIQLLMIEKLES